MVRIQDIELQTGMDRATIRYYEKEGLLTPKRLENGYRSYCEDDITVLLRIKLLRKLGISLSNIKDLQKGKGQFSDILSQQISVLEGQIQQNQKAAQVCRQLRQTEVDFADIDSKYYLEMLNSQSDHTTGRYNDNVIVEHHPIRRFIARYIDLTLFYSFIQFLLVVILRIRPWSNPLAILIYYISLMFYIPVEALFYHFWGTTPGKWVLGIRLEGINGGKLTFESAIFRAFSVVFAGCGLHVPFIRIWRLHKSYRTISRGEELPWDEETEVIYTNWNTRKKVFLAVMVLTIILMIYGASTDAILPKYREFALTPEEFNENYSHYETMFKINDQYSLQHDGSWKKYSSADSEIIIIRGEGEYSRAPFIYTLRDGKIIEIRYTDQWSDLSFSSVIPDYCICAVYTAVGSNPEISYKELIRAGEDFSQTFIQQFDSLSLKDHYVGNFSVKGTQISWDIRLEDVEYIIDEQLFSPDDTGSYTIDLLISFASP